MSDPSSSTPSLAGVLQSLMLIGSPVALVLMLGLVGVYFIAGMGDGSRDAKPAPAPVPTAAEAESGAAAPVADSAMKSAAADASASAAPSDTGGMVAASAEIDPAVMELGKSTYATCAPCHGPDGKGLPVGSVLMAPNFVGSEMLLGDPEASILLLLKGILKENNDYMGVMAPMGASLSDEQIAAVLTYLRNFGGNQASAVTPEEVTAARAKFDAIDAPAGVKRAEIPAVIEAHR